MRFGTVFITCGGTYKRYFKVNRGRRDFTVLTGYQSF